MRQFCSVRDLGTVTSIIHGFYSVFQQTGTSKVIIQASKKALPQCCTAADVKQNFAVHAFTNKEICSGSTFSFLITLSEVYEISY